MEGISERCDHILSLLGLEPVEEVTLYEQLALISDGLDSLIRQTGYYTGNGILG